MLKLLTAFWLAIAAFAIPSPARALPGQTPVEVADWLRIHPTLKTGLAGELTARLNNGNQAFIFEASLSAPGWEEFATGDFVRSERLETYDRVRGVSAEDLQDDLRRIYGVEIEQDYQQGLDQNRLVYRYPAPVVAEDPYYANLPRGWIVLGDRFAYWIELSDRRANRFDRGQIVVLLPEDVSWVEAYLRDRL